MNDRRGATWIRVGAPIALAVAIASCSNSATPTIASTTTTTQPATSTTTTPAATSTTTSTSTSTSTSTTLAASTTTTAAPQPVPKTTKPLSSAWFVSPSEGFVLAGATDTHNAVVLHTTDRGATWLRTGTTPFVVSPEPLSSASLQFADATNGWLIADRLYTTHDGGATWNANLAVGHPWGIGVGRSHVHVVGGFTGSDFAIFSSPIDHDAFIESPTHIQPGAGPLAEFQFALALDSGWLVYNDRVVIAGARLVKGQWVAWQPPCTDKAGDAVIATSPTADTLVAMCTEGTWSAAQQSVHVYLSHDGGTTFTETAQPLPTNTDADGTEISRSARGRLVASYTTGFVTPSSSPVLAVSFNDGANWYVLGHQAFSDLHFLTANDGFGRSGDTIVVTSDAGRHWATVLGA